MKISIITPTYNSEKFINDFLNSVGKQTYKNFEHIIIDGASSDKTLELLKAKKKQITHLLSENDRGVFDAMNKGIKIAKGEIIGFLNSDDFYFNNEILSNVAHLFIKDNTLEAVYANLIYTKKDNIFKNVRFWKSNNFYSGLFSKGWSPPHPTFFVKKSVYEKYGMFNLDYGNASDIEIMMRFLEVYKIKSRYVSDTWVKMRLGGLSNNSIRNIIIQNLQILKALKKNNLAYNVIIFFFNKLILRLKQFFTSECN